MHVKISAILFLSVSLFCVGVLTQTVDDIVNDIGLLFAESETYEYPTNYDEFYREHFINGGVHGIYDFIIVGAGSAGTVLANRLSEIFSFKILLLEAGQNETEYTDIPGIAPLIQFTDYNWGFLSTKQSEAFQGLTNKRGAVPRGRGLGGSSVINFMFYTRGNKHDFDHWGVNGWTYNDVLPYFNEIENCSLTGEENIRHDCHLLHGDLNVQFVQTFDDFSQTYLDANVELGGKILDYNGKDQMGFSRLQSSTIDGRRDSGNKAFLTKVLHRRNLHVRTGAFVTKLKIENKVAVGVEFVVGNKSYVAYVRKEVILSAGAVASPQILMLSGIGPKEELKRLNINVVKDLPVGQNLHDHIMFNCFLLSNYTPPQVSLPDSVQDYLDGFGLLTAAGNVQAIGYINTEHPNASYPDIEHFFIPYFDNTNVFLIKGVRYLNESAEIVTKPFPSGAPLLSTVLLHEKSRGSIKLKSNSPFDHPLIDFNYFSHPDDIETLLAGIKKSVEVIDTNAMKKYNVSIPDTPLLQCNHTEFLSDDYWRCMAKQLAVSVYHLAGTCKMGEGNDGESVVDQNLRVHGIRNLRVADASIMPEPISGHTNAPTFMIGAKASDIIKKFHFI